MSTKEIMAEVRSLLLESDLPIAKKLRMIDLIFEYGEERVNDLQKLLK